METLKPYWKNSLKISLSLLIGIAIGVSLTTHLYSLWGKSLWIQVGAITGLGIAWGAVIYWGLFRSQFGRNISWKKGGFCPYVIVASILLGFIPLPTFTHAAPLLLEIEVMPSIRDDSVSIISIKYGDGKDISFQDLEKTGHWTSQDGMLVGQGAGSRVSYRVISEKNGKHWGEVRVLLQQSPTSGRASIRMDGVEKIVDLQGDDINDLTHVVIPVAPSPLRAFFLGLCDLLTLIVAFFFVSVWAGKIMQQISGKYRMPQVIVRLANLLVSGIKKPWAAPLILFFYTFLAHGLLLLNEGIYSDDFLYVTYLIKRDWNALFSLFDQTGRPLLALMHWPFTIFPDIVFGYKVVIFVLIYLSSLLVYSICKRSGYLSQNESLLLAVFSITFPANQFFVAIGMSSYYILYTLFLLAVYLDVLSLGKQGNIRLILFFCSLTFFFFSFTLSSLLVFYYGYLIIRYFIICKMKKTDISAPIKHKQSTWLLGIIAAGTFVCLWIDIFMERYIGQFPQIIYYKTYFIYLGFSGICFFLILFVLYLLEHIYLTKSKNLFIHFSIQDDVLENSHEKDLLDMRFNWVEIIRTGFLGLLPIVNWYISVSFFPPYGYYKGYNGFNITSFSPLLFINGIKYFTEGILPHFLDKYWGLGIVALVLLILANIRIESNSKTLGSGIFIVGFVLLLTGIFPYLVRNTPAASSGSYTRNLILVGLPMSMIFIAFFRWAFSGSQWIRRIGFVIAFLLALEFSYDYVQSYLNWQGRAVWEKSLIINITKQPEFLNNSVLWVDSAFTESEKIGDTEVNEQWVWNGLFRQASNDESHFGVEIIYSGEDIQQRKWEQFENRIKNYFDFIQNFGGNGESILRRRDMWLVSNFDPFGCQAILYISREQGADNIAGMALNYYYYRFFQSDQMTAYLESLTHLKITPIDTPTATNCKR